MRLKLVATVDFRNNEATNFLELEKKNDLQLGPNDVVCLVSQSKNQLVFVYRPVEVDLTKYGARQGTARVFHSERLRLDRSTWEPLMLQNYANMVGITLDGLRRFEDVFPNYKPGTGNVVSFAKKAA